MTSHARTTYGRSSGFQSGKPNGGNGQDRPRLVETYDYPDEHGELLSQKVRLVPKEFRQRRPDGNGGWVWNLEDVRRVIYRLPEIVEAVAQGRPIFFAEGEKAVDALVGAGVVATCSGGANSWDDRFAEDLKGRERHHPSGQRRPRRACEPDSQVAEWRCYEHQGAATAGTARRRRRLRLDRGGRHRREAMGLVETEAREWKPKAEQHSKTTEGSMLVYRCASEVDLEPIVWLWPGRLAKGKHTCIAGDPGTGKSQVAIAIIAAITRRRVAMRRRACSTGKCHSPQCRGWCWRYHLAASSRSRCRLRSRVCR